MGNACPIYLGFIFEKALKLSKVIQKKKGWTVTMNQCVTIWPVLSVILGWSSRLVYERKVLSRANGLNVVTCVRVSQDVCGNMHVLIDRRACCAFVSFFVRCIPCSLCTMLARSYSKLKVTIGHQKGRVVTYHRLHPHLSFEINIYFTYIPACF